jgi:hypothetical protein
MQEMGNRVEQEKAILTWKGPNRPFRKFEKKNLSMPVVIALLVALILALAGEWMLIGVVVALVFAYYAWTIFPPEIVEFVITNKGVKIHDHMYAWEMLTRWWIEEKWGHKVLMLEAPGVGIGRLVMPLGDMDEGKLVEEMERWVLHEKPVETVVDKMGKWLSEKFPLVES